MNNNNNIKMKKILLLVIVFSLYTCNTNKKLNNLNKVIVDISEEYDTVINYEIGKSLKLNKESSFIKLIIKDSEILETYKNKYIPASNISTMLFEQVKEYNFDEFQIEIISKTNESTFFNFYSENLKIFTQKKIVFDKINKLIILKKYNQISDLFSPNLLNDEKKEDLAKYFNNFNEQYGLAKEIIYHGFALGNLENKGYKMPYVAYFGIVKRDNTDTKISVVINQENDKIFSIKFDW